jgi:trehalose synthase-fused probable maltokinase
VRDRLSLLSHVGAGGKLIRHHGDLHLGQTLLAPDRWIVLDFEGEPARPLLERRRKRSPLRDVAGMLRSFAYAASAAELLRGVPAPADWEERARSAFLDAYLQTVEPALLPAGRPATDKLLAIFELEKAVYELRYELNNRPDWVPIPVAGIARLLQEEVAT